MSVMICLTAASPWNILALSNSAAKYFLTKRNAFRTTSGSEALGTSESYQQQQQQEQHYHLQIVSWKKHCYKLNRGFGIFLWIDQKACYKSLCVLSWVIPKRWYYKVQGGKYNQDAECELERFSHSTQTWCSKAPRKGVFSLQEQERMIHWFELAS